MSATDPKAAVKDIERVLDRFHGAAAAADAKTYFDFLATDGVFIGTDASERWTVEQFKVYAAQQFSSGRGWAYVPRARNVALSDDVTFAWFDELLDNVTYGVCRGSGVLRRIGSAWKISQYHLTIPVPNTLARKVAALIRDEG